jgi:hypothetical protein
MTAKTKKPAAKKAVAKKPATKKATAKKPAGKTKTAPTVAKTGKKTTESKKNAGKTSERSPKGGKPVVASGKKAGATNGMKSKPKESTAKGKAVKQGMSSKKESKHWFPKDAKPAVPDKAPAKKSPWQRKMVPINYGTIGGPVTNIKDLFHKYIDDNHRKMTAEQRQSLWQAVGLRMLSNSKEKLSEIIDQEIKNSSGTK